ncbi:MAG: DciA family protein [Magnetovibrio sp.]|nr:DciA family protein [Magnetovibrio sp.]
MATKSSKSGKKYKARTIEPSDIRTHRVKPVAQTVDRLTRGILGNHGFAHATIVTKWPQIVGDDMARHTLPEKIVFSRDGATGGTLHLKTDSGAFAMELQHNEPLVLERINTFFGYRAVVRIKLIQGPLPRNRETAQRAKPPRPLSKAETEAIAGTVATVDDPELQEALARLGRNVMGKNSTK